MALDGVDLLLSVGAGMLHKCYVSERLWLKAISCSNSTLLSRVVRLVVVSVSAIGAKKKAKLTFPGELIKLTRG